MSNGLESVSALVSGPPVAVLETTDLVRQEAPAVREQDLEVLQFVERAAEHELPTMIFVSSDCRSGLSRYHQSAAAAPCVFDA